MSQGLIGMRNILRGIIERKKTVLECPQQSHYFHGPIDESVSKFGKPTVGVGWRDGKS